MIDPQTNKKAIFCLDYDGTCTVFSGWKGATICPDPPVDGLFPFLEAALQEFEINIFSTRSHQGGGVEAMRNWFFKHELSWRHWPRPEDGLIGTAITAKLHFPSYKPPAFVSIDDRGWQFTGAWPSIEAMKAFKTWQGK